jgi:hypothetical protein
MTDEPPEATSRIDRRTFWLSVLASVFASVLFGIFFQPIVTGISNLIVSAIGIFGKSYVDNIFNGAAQSPVDFLIYLIFLMLLTLPVPLAATAVLATTLMQSLAEPSRKLRLIVYCFGFVTFVTMIIVAAGLDLSIRVNASFQRKLMALTPVISEQERKTTRTLGDDEVGI